MVVFFFFFKQKTAYEMRISDWSSDVCSSDLALTSPDVRIAQAPTDRLIRRDGARQPVRIFRVGQGALLDQARIPDRMQVALRAEERDLHIIADRKSTRLNSSH